MDDKKINAIIKKLQSKKNDEIVFTIKQLRNTGNAKILPHLFDLLLVNKTEAVRDQAQKLLNDLKDEESKEEIVNALKNDKYKSLHKDIIISCWQSRLDYTDELLLFIDFFKKSNFELAFEAFTVIDNFENTIDAKILEKAISDLKSDIYKFKDTDKEQLYIELVHLLESRK